MCTRNHVLRRIFLVINDIGPHMGITMKSGHDLDKLSQQPIYIPGDGSVKVPGDFKPNVEVCTN